MDKKPENRVAEAIEAVENDEKTTEKTTEKIVMIEPIDPPVRQDPFIYTLLTDVGNVIVTHTSSDLAEVWNYIDACRDDGNICTFPEAIIRADKVFGIESGGFDDDDSQDDDDDDDSGEPLTPIAFVADKPRRRRKGF